MDKTKRTENNKTVSKAVISEKTNRKSKPKRKDCSMIINNNNKHTWDADRRGSSITMALEKETRLGSAFRYNSFKFWNSAIDF